MSRVSPLVGSSPSRVSSRSAAVQPDGVAAEARGADAVVQARERVEMPADVGLDAVLIGAEPEPERDAGHGSGESAAGYRTWRVRYTPRMQPTTQVSRNASRRTVAHEGGRLVSIPIRGLRGRPSARGRAAVHAQHLAGHPGGVLAEQVADAARHVIRGAQPAQRVVALLVGDRLGDVAPQPISTFCSSDDRPMPVSGMVAGATALTMTPCGPNSTASALVSPTMPHLDAM